MVLPVSVSRAALRGGIQRLAAANTVSRSSIVERPLSSSSKVSSSSHSTMHGNDPEILEREKHRNLSGTQKHHYENAPGWNENLASESEATVKSLRSDTKTSSADLQKQTIEHLKASDLQNSEESSITAKDVKDEVTGPLQTAQGHESGNPEEGVVKN